MKGEQFAKVPQDFAGQLYETYITARKFTGVYIVTSEPSSNDDAKPKQIALPSAVLLRLKAHDTAVQNAKSQKDTPANTTGK